MKWKKHNQALYLSGHFVAPLKLYIQARHIANIGYESGAYGIGLQWLFCFCVKL